MDDQTNTTAGWVLFSGIVALGFYTLSSHYFQADKPHAPHEGGFPVEAEEGGGGDSGPSLNTLLAEGDAAKGEKVFAKCTACHTINQGGANGIGPNLFGVPGEAIGTGHGGFAFSSALSGHGGTWTFENLDEWLKSPKGFAPGTNMSFAGLSKAEDRANLMLYLNSQGGKLPIPAADAPAAEEGAEAAEGAEGAAETEAATEAGADSTAADAAGDTAAADPKPAE
ncbi:MAG: c-type cytochrome [Sphingomonadaceae bacterium]